MNRLTPTKAAGAIVLAGALALGACGKSDKPTYEAGVTDQGGGQLQVTDKGSDAVPVKVPDTAMTNVPEAAPSPTPNTPPE
ncbi:hypothetical protein [Tsuneonella mangrovi]|uniref:hypothetical protein n=1 Tax=Tsuneonella mangrovi TaxID=1982042 RepID=UPI001F0B1A64|nr:hypothetical protein [Tsuneonella mangrovi]